MKRLIAVLMVLSMLLAGCTKAATDQTAPVEIDPNSNTAAKTRVDVRLYYANSDFSSLIGQTRSIDLPVNDRVEQAIVQALINGPDSKNDEFLPLINPKTQVVNVSESNDILFIVLSRQFLDWSNVKTSGEITNMMKFLAVYSIVNTLIEATGYSRVQLLIDTDNSGTGQRLQRSEVGFDGDGVLEPLERKGSIVLTPYNTLKKILEGAVAKDAVAIYPLIAYNDEGTRQKPDEAAFKTTVQESRQSIESFTLGEVIVNDTGTSAVVMATYSVRSQSGDVTTKANIPVTLSKENDVWRLKYSVFKKVLLGS